jgi:hypothetical protein
MRALKKAAQSWRPFLFGSVLAQVTTGFQVCLVLAEAHYGLYRSEHALDLYALHILQPTQAGTLHLADDIQVVDDLAQFQLCLTIL